MANEHLKVKRIDKGSGGEDFVTLGCRMQTCSYLYEIK